MLVKGLFYDITLPDLWFDLPKLSRQDLQFFHELQFLDHFFGMEESKDFSIIGKRFWYYFV